MAKSKEEIRSKINSVPEEKPNKKAKKDEISSLVDLIKEKYGLEVEPVKNTAYRIKNVIEFINEKYDFRYNIINRETEYKFKEDKQFKYFEDSDFRDLATELDLNNLGIAENKFRNLIYGSKISERYNPFIDYFNRIGKCDSIFEYTGPAKEKTFKEIKSGRDYIKEYCDQVYLPDEKERIYFVEGFRKWFVALVVSLVVDIPHKYYINQICLVLFGGQGKLKSTWIENMIPQDMRMKYIYSSHFDPRQRDHMQFLATHIIIILEEMAALNKTDIETMKGVMTETKFAGRLSYDKEKTYLKRRASFAATQNNKEFMKDDSGSRRFLVIEIESISIQKDFPLNKMYAQALQHYKDGYKYWFDHDDIKIQESKNAQFQLKTFEFELVEKYYEIPTDDEIRSESEFVKYLSSTDIAVYLSKDNNVNVNNTVKANIGKALTALGFKKITRRLNGKTPKLWCVKNSYSTISKSVDEDYNSSKENDII